MSALYLETSSLLAWLFGESRADGVRASVDGADSVATSTLTFLETERALVRAESEHLLKAADAQRLRGLMIRTRSAWILMSVSDEILTRAARPFPVEPVRTLDAIHLATALELTKALPDLQILTFDRRVAENALALGLSEA